MATVDSSLITSSLLLCVALWFPTARVKKRYLKKKTGAGKLLFATFSSFINHTYEATLNMHLIEVRDGGDSRWPIAELPCVTANACTRKNDLSSRPYKQPTKPVFTSSAAATYSVARTVERFLLAG